MQEDHSLPASGWFSTLLVTYHAITNLRFLTAEQLLNPSLFDVDLT